MPPCTWHCGPRLWWDRRFGVTSPAAWRGRWIARRVAFARRLSSIPLCRDRVSDVAVDLQSLVDLLVDPGPVSARWRGPGPLALLGDGAGPLYNRANTDDLRAQVRRTVEALDPLDTPSHLT